MKNKVLILSTVALLALTGCHKANNAKLKVLSPIGAPAVALYHLAGNDNFTTTSDPQSGLIPMFHSAEYDVIVAPTAGGLKQILNAANPASFKIAATITFGNMYIVATGKDDVLKTEMKLRKVFKKENWNKRHLQMVLFGRYKCKAIKPECENCKLREICKGVK